MHTQTAERRGRKTIAYIPRACIDLGSHTTPPPPCRPHRHPKVPAPPSFSRIDGLRRRRRRMGAQLSPKWQITVAPRSRWPRLFTGSERDPQTEPPRIAPTMTAKAVFLTNFNSTSRWNRRKTARHPRSYCTHTSCSLNKITWVCSIPIILRLDTRFYAYDYTTYTSTHLFRTRDLRR